MTQSPDVTLATQTGADYRTEHNSINQAFLTQHSGTSAPTYAAAGCPWIDTTATPWVYNIYDGTDWIALGTINATTNVFQAAGLTIGTNVQAYDAGLTSIAGLTTAADKMIYTTASDTYAVTALTSAGRALLDDASASAQRTTLGLGSAATLTAGTSANNVVQLNGSAQLPAVDGSLLTGISAGLSAASTAQMEAGAVDTVAVTPLVAQRHPSACKAWALLNGTGAIALAASYNFDSPTDNGTGDYTMTLTTNFSSANYAIQIFADREPHNSLQADISSRLAGSFRFTLENQSGTAQDADAINILCHGGQ